MDKVIKEIEVLLRDKVSAGMFNSPEHALEVFKQWLEQIERERIEERMRNEDA